jgi:peptidoglycan hydrolase-like protein with peptidoglycan-binding domain
MLRKISYSFIVLIFALSLSGCITLKKNTLEQQALRNQVSALEAQIQDKDQEIVNLRDSLAKEIQEKEELNKKAPVAKPIKEVKSRPNMRQIQIALKNAGYDPGPIDGKNGKKTRDALKAFQKAKGLKPDGKAGKLTWGLLREYLNTQTK